MKKFSQCLSAILLPCSLFLLCCSKSPTPTITSSATLPQVTVDSVTNVSYSSALVYTTIASDGGSAVTARGICWDSSSNPTTASNKTIDGAGTGQYSSTITGLKSVTTYYVRSYSTNSVGTAYGTQITFTTGVLPNISAQWTLANLRVVTYANGDSIPQVTDTDQWKNLTTGAWCYYNNDSTTDSIYGKLYNWYAVNDIRGLAPTGWHIPSKQEWTNMVNFYGGDSTAGGKLKSTNLWSAPNTGATNETGFNAVPSGFRNELGYFAVQGLGTIWWTAKEHDATTAVERSLAYDNPFCYMYFYDKHCGMSVRCIKN